MSHQCPIGVCTKALDASKLMCYPHWAMVPGNLQQAVYRAYKRGLGIGSGELLHAQDAAIQAVEDKLSKREATT